MTSAIIILLSVLFFLVAVLYSSAGFGGGSSYLALLVLFCDDFVFVRSTALICNVLVVSGSLVAFGKSGAVSWRLIKKLLPLIAFSIPLAYLGATVPIKPVLFFVLLGLALVTSAIAMFYSTTVNTRLENRDCSEEPENGRRGRLLRDGFAGGLLGGTAGMVGIGGGIFLSPYLHLSNWNVPRKISVATAFFILVNSLAGILGQWSHTVAVARDGSVWPLLIAVVAGGQIGVRANIGMLSQKGIRRVTAIVILLAGLNVLQKYGLDWIR